MFKLRLSLGELCECPAIRCLICHKYNKHTSTMRSVWMYSSAPHCFLASQVGVLNRKRPTCIALSRQNMPNLPGTSSDGVQKGAYIIKDCEGTPDIILMGTGSELELAYYAAEVSLKPNLQGGSWLGNMRSKDFVGNLGQRRSLSLEGKLSSYWQLKTLSTSMRRIWPRRARRRAWCPWHAGSCLRSSPSPTRTACCLQLCPSVWLWRPAAPSAGRGE